MTSCMDFVQNNLKIIKQNLSTTKWFILIGKKKYKILVSVGAVFWSSLHSPKPSQGRRVVEESILKQLKQFTSILCRF